MTALGAGWVPLCRVSVHRGSCKLFLIFFAFFTFSLFKTRKKFSHKRSLNLIGREYKEVKKIQPHSLETFLTRNSSFMGALCWLCGILGNNESKLDKKILYEILIKTVLNRSKKKNWISYFCGKKTNPLRSKKLHNQIFAFIRVFPPE